MPSCDGDVDSAQANSITYREDTCSTHNKWWNLDGERIFPAHGSDRCPGCIFDEVYACQQTLGAVSWEVRFRRRRARRWSEQRGWRNGQRAVQDTFARTSTTSILYQDIHIRDWDLDIYVFNTLNCELRSHEPPPFLPCLFLLILKD